MLGSSSALKSGVYGFLNTPVATTTLSASRRLSPVWTTYFPPSFVSASTETPLRTGSSKPSAYATR